MQIKNGLFTPVSLLVPLFLTLGCLAQTHSFYITGMVLMEEVRPGEHAPEIQVELTTEHGGEGIKTVVTESGDYKFGGLETGTYLITAKAPGYAPVTTRVEINNVGQVRGVTRLDLVKEAGLPVITHDGEVVSQNALKAPKAARQEAANAQLLMQSGKFDDAEKAIDKALRLYPDYAFAFCLRGELSEKRGNSGQAATAYSEALTRDPDLYRAYLPLCDILWKQADYQALKRTAEQWKQMQSLSAVPRYYLAVALYQLGEYPAAVQEANRAKQFPHETVPHLSLLLANCYIKLRDPRTAAVQLLEFLKEHPDDALAGQAKKTLEELREVGRY